MKERSKFLIKNMGILTISNFSSKILVFLLVPLYTSVLTTSEYGIYDLVISTASLLFPILTLNITDAVMRFLMEKNKDENSIAMTGIKYVLLSSVFIAVFLYINGRLYMWQEICGLEIYIFLYYLSYVLNQFFIQFAKGNEHIFDMGVAAVLSTAIMVGGNVLFLPILRWGLRGFLTATIVSQALPAAYFFIRLRFWSYLKSLKTDEHLHREMLVYCVPLIATTVGWWMNSAADKYVVTFICGIAANGVLAVAYKIPQILNTLQGIFIQAWQISAIKEYGKGEAGLFYGEIFSVVILLMSAACAWLIFLSKPLASILYAKDFYVAWKYVPFLLISSVLNCASGLLGPILSAQKDSRSMAEAAICGALANGGMNIVFVLIIGIQGAAIATVLSSLIIYLIRKKKVGMGIQINGYRAVLVTWMFLCVQAVLEIYTPFWYAELVLMLVMLWINRMGIKKLFYTAKSVLIRNK